MNKPEMKQPDPIDIALGSRIRQRRHGLNMSLDQLGKQIGVTFQQVQKYENGSNRVSFSRMVKICHALRCGVIDLIGDLDKSKDSSLFARHIARLNEPGAAELLEAYSAIKSPKHRRAILNLAEQLAGGKSLPVLDSPQDGGFIRLTFSENGEYYTNRMPAPGVDVEVKLDTGEIRRAQLIWDFDECSFEAPNFNEPLNAVAWRPVSRPADAKDDAASNTRLTMYLTNR